MLTFLVQSTNLSMTFINIEKSFRNIYTVKGDKIYQITSHIDNSLRVEICYSDTSWFTVRYQMEDLLSIIPVRYLVWYNARYKSIDSLL